VHFIPYKKLSYSRRHSASVKFGSRRVYLKSPSKLPYHTRRWPLNRFHVTDHSRRIADVARTHVPLGQALRNPVPIAIVGFKAFAFGAMSRCSPSYYFPVLGKFRHFNELYQRLLQSLDVSLMGNDSPGSCDFRPCDIGRCSSIRFQAIRTLRVIAFLAREVGSAVYI
jgi:hypothetical protein